MPFAEVVYETGDSSVVSYDDQDELLNGLREHHRRAVNGEAAMPGIERFVPAVRVKKVFLYDEHPGDYNVDAVMSTDQLSSELTAYLKASGAMANLWEVAAFVRDLSNPHIEKEHPHDSQYKAKETGVLTEGWGDN